MNGSVDPFEKYANSLTSDQRDRIRTTMDELGLKRTDALFHIMAALDYYRMLYERVPAQIKEAGDNALQAVDQAARLQGEREFAAARATLADEVVAAARKLSTSRDRSELMLYVSLAVGTVLIVMSTAFVVGRLSANDAYRAQTAYAVGWFDSEDGQYAYHLSRLGVLRELQNCRAQKRTFAIGPTKVQCGVMSAPMRDAKSYKSLPDNVAAHR